MGHIKLAIRRQIEQGNNRVKDERPLCSFCGWRRCLCREMSPEDPAVCASIPETTETLLPMLPLFRLASKGGLPWLDEIVWKTVPAQRSAQAIAASVQNKRIRSRKQKKRESLPPGLHGSGKFFFWCCARFGCVYASLLKGCMYCS